jgi:hypothetical protein
MYINNEINAANIAKLDNLNNKAAKDVTYIKINGADLVLPINNNLIGKMNSNLVYTNSGMKLNIDITNTLTIKSYPDLTDLKIKVEVLLLPININLHGQHNNSLVYTRT